MLTARRPGDVVVAKCYRLLRSILSTAVEDELIAWNPCVVKGAGVEHSPERPVATIAEVYAIADALGARHRAMVLIAMFGGLRLGEILGL
jgi:integrase